MILLQKQNQLAGLMETNQIAKHKGFVLNTQDAELILEERSRALQEQQRIEFGAGIAERIICEFCDSDFINQENYVQKTLNHHPAAGNLLSV